MNAKINLIATVSTIIGLMGVIDTAWFYSAGARSVLPSLEFTIGWPSFALYINFYILGIFLGLGIKTQSDPFRILGLIVSVVWIFGQGISTMVLLAELFLAANLQAAMLVLASIAIDFALLGYSVWQFSVLRSREAVLYFGG